MIGQLRWACELVVDEDPHKAKLGLDLLTDLASSAFLAEGFIDRALTIAIRQPRDEIEEAEKAGEEVRVVWSDLEGFTASDLALLGGQPTEASNGAEAR